MPKSRMTSKQMAELAAKLLKRSASKDVRKLAASVLSQRAPKRRKA